MRAVIVRGVKYKVDQAGLTLQRVQTAREKGTYKNFKKSVVDRIKEVVIGVL